MIYRNVLNFYRTPDARSRRMVSNFMATADRQYLVCPHPTEARPNAVHALNSKLEETYAQPRP